MKVAPSKKFKIGQKVIIRTNPYKKFLGKIIEVKETSAIIEVPGGNKIDKTFREIKIKKS